MSSFKTKKISNPEISKQRDIKTNVHIVDETADSQKVRAKKLKTRIIGWLLIIASILFIGILWLKAIGNIQFSTSDDFRVFQPTKVALEKKTATENFLIAGIGWLGHPGGELTDSLMLAKADSKKQTVTILSIPRDLYVAYGKNSAGKINALYPMGKSSWSGINLLAEKVTEITGEPIDHFVVIDFSGFKWIVDALGWVTVDVPADIYDREYPNENWWYEIFSLKKWVQELDGKTALKFARSRHSTSDFDRSERQQLLIKAIKDKALSLDIITNPNKISNILDSVRNNISTDLTVGDIVNLWLLFKNIQNGDIHMYSLNNACSGGNCQAGSFLYQPSMDYFGGAWALIPEWAVLSKLSKYEDIKQYAKLIFGYPELQNQPKNISIITTRNNLNKAQLIRKKLSQFWFPIDYSSVIMQTGSVVGNTRVVSYWNETAAIGFSEKSPLIGALQMVESTVPYVFQGNNEYVVDQGPRIEIILWEDIKEFFTFAKEASYLPQITPKVSNTATSKEKTPVQNKVPQIDTTQNTQETADTDWDKNETSWSQSLDIPAWDSKHPDMNPSEPYQFQPGEWETFDTSDTLLP